MLLEESLRRQQELSSLLYEMASSCMDDVQLRSVAIKLKTLYTSNFRHNYSQFFPMIVEMSQEGNDYSLEYLSTNLEAVRAMVEESYLKDEKEFTTLYRPLSKLSDHINLEIGRYSYYSQNEQKVLDLERKNLMLQTELRNATTALEKAQEKVSTMQTELISVLSIFVAIVLAFSGSISFLGNALSGMTQVTVFKSAFFVLLCGFVIMNLIFLMMYIVGKITGRSIYARCKTEKCTCGKDGSPACNGLKRLRKRLPYIYWINVMLIILMIVDIILWCCNINFWLLPL